MLGAKNQYLNHYRPVGHLADGEASVIDTRGCLSLSIQAGAGATVTFSRVDAMDAEAHGDGQDAVAATEFNAIPVEWPFYRVSVAGGTAKVAVV